MLPTTMQQALTTSFTDMPLPASVLVLLTNEAHPKVLLSRRTEHLKSHAGQVSFVGGKRETDDTTNTSVALREACEEAGIQPNDVTVLGELPVQKTRIGLSVVPIVAVVDADIVLTAQQSEVARLFWVPLSFIAKENIQPFAIKYRGIPIKTASLQYDNEIIWGLTGRIIMSLANKAYGKKDTWKMVMF